jgi:hypothetical protein
MLLATSCEGELLIASYYLRRGRAIDPHSSDGWTRQMAALKSRHLNVVQL